jgi:hypothetical protein
MLDSSLFISEEVHEREVELPDGKKHTLYFKEVPASVFRKYGMAERSDDEEARAGSLSILIAASLCDKDGKPALSYERALQLKPAAATKLFEAVLDVNRAKKEDEGNA